MLSPLHFVAGAKNDPKIKSKSKVRIEGAIENESFSTTRVNPKTIFELKNRPLGPQKVKKKIQNLIQNQKSELKELQKIRVLQVHE